MRREQITSRANPLVARMRKVRASREARHEEGLFLCEGPKMLREALKWGAEIESILCVAGMELEDIPPSVRVAEGPEELIAAAADTKTPQGVVFLCRLPGSNEKSISGQRFLVLDGVQDPGNVGTIWRTADAFGADGLILTGACADPWGPKTVRSTMGAAFRLPVWERPLEQLAAELSALGVPLYATALREDTEDVRQATLSGKAAVIIGSEGRGISPQALALCERTLKIPMRARCESLNAAAAACVVLWEMARERL